MRAYSAPRFCLRVIISLNFLLCAASGFPEQPVSLDQSGHRPFGQLGDDSNTSPESSGSPIATAVTQSPPSANFFLHGTGPNDNPPTLFLDNTTPTATTPKFKDSASINFNGGNPWKEVGTWAAQSSFASGTFNALSDLHVWLGLKNSDDQGTNFDVRAEAYKNGVLLTSGVTLCVVGVTRNPDNAKEVTVSFAPFAAALFNGTTDVLSLKILTRIGTNASNALCGGHSNAVGLRLYFDAGSRSSGFAAAIDAGDTVPPTITAAVTPAPNAAGWNKSNATVTFTCSDSTSGVASCTAPVSVTAETSGETVVGVAVDTAGNTASTFVSVKLDRTPPSLTVASPANGSQVFASTVTVIGTVTDLLSGVSNVTCNGTPATVNGGSFSCAVALNPGTNPVNITATDIAGNTGTSSVSLTYTRAPIVSITSPANLSYLNISPTTVTGTVDDPTATVTINSVPAAVVNGSFSAALPLAEGPNTVTASATAGSGAVGTSSIEVTLDTTPPHVTITSPPDQYVTTDSSLSVAGNVNDIVVGTVNSEQAQVTVNGVTGQVANRTFLAVNVPLVMGPNIIQAVGRDRVGNAATTQIVVTRQTPALPQIRSISGNNQTGAIGSTLPAPLVVAVTDAAGNPVINKPVIFKVVQDDGMVNSGGPPAPTVIATTNSQGQAQAQWKLGMRAGAGGNSVEAYSVGFSGTAIFTATGTQGPAGKIVVDTGNDQIGAINQPLAKPLIVVVVDSGNNRLGGTPVTFTVKAGGGAFAGQSSVTVNADSDGRAAATLTLGLQEGNANNLVEANFPSNTGFPASFTASGRAPANPLNTTISGVVLDNTNVPIPGVTIRAVLTNLLNSNSSIVQSVAAIQTDAQGQFSIPQAPVGFVKLLVDGSTAQRPGTFPTLDYDLVTVAGRANTLSQPIYLLPLSTNNQLCVTATTGGGTLTIPEAPGFSLTFGPGQVTFPGGSKTGCVSVTVVHSDKVPMVPGFGQQPRFIVTIQPAGATFNPPAAITLPNVDGLRPRAVTEMYSFDHDIGSFVAIGTGVVSDDGQVIRSSPGVGVLKAGWHCGGDPNANGTAADCADCQICQGDQCVADPAKNGQACSSPTVPQGTCKDGTCVKLTADVDINSTAAKTDDLTVLNPAQTIPIRITLHGGPGHVQLTVTPAGRASLDRSALDLTDGGSDTVTLTPSAESQAVNDVVIKATVDGNDVGQGTLTIVKVTIPTIKATNTPTGMANRIPPRVDSSFQITVLPNLGSSGQVVTLATLNTNATNGDFTIEGAATKDITTTTTVKLRGTVQTAATAAPGGGNAGRIKLVAKVRSANAVQSNGFSVAAIPVNFSTAFDSDINDGTSVGLRVRNSWTSDSGVLADLDAAERSEQIDVVTATGVFSGTGGVTSGFFPATAGSLFDSHSTPNAVLTGNGLRVANQTFIFNDRRTGATNAVCPNSGFVITRTATLAAGTVTFVTRKVGAATTANGFASAAGTGSAQNTFRLRGGVVQP